MKIRESIEIKSPCEAVFAFYTNREQWSGVMPKTDLPIKAELVSKTPNSSVVVRERLGQLLIITTTTMSPVAEGCAVTMELDLSMTGPLGGLRMALFGSTLRRAYERGIRSLLVRIKARLEGTLSPPVPRIASRRETRAICITMALVAAAAALVLELFILNLPFFVVLPLMVLTYLVAYVLLAKYAGSLFTRLVRAIPVDLGMRS